MSSSRPRSSVVVMLGSAQTLAWGSSYYLPAILAVPMAEGLGLTAGWVFGAFSAALVLSALLGPLAGARIDRFGGRGVLIGSSLVFAAGLGLLGLAQGPVSMFAGWLLLGVGMAMGLYEAGFATLAGLYGREARGAITGITLIAGFASTICWPVTAWVEAEAGWRAACFFWAGAHLLLGLPLNALLPRRKGAPESRPAAQPKSKATPQEAKETAKQRRALLLLAFVFTATWFTSTAMAAHLPRLLQEAGATPAAAVAAAALTGPAQVGARLFEYTLLRRFHPLLSARLAAAAHPLGALLLVLLGPAGAAVFTLLHGAGNGILTIAKGTLPLSLFGPGGYGLRQGLLMAPARFGQAAAPFLFALAIDHWGLGALGLTSLLALASLAALLALRQG
ncbi:MFS transporter [Aquibaculum sediminis]|uniref:MFS transporter n=1 Tax=Aquibaculum sediminis TaxID=3231907 RepID=UPI0034552F74